MFIKRNLIFPLLLSFCSLWAQSDIAEEGAKNQFLREIPKVQLSENLSRKYEALLSRSLNEYYGFGSFVVDARAYLDEELVPLEMEPAAGLDSDIEELPGLPFIPDDMRAPSAGLYSDSLIVTRYRKELKLKYVEISVLVNESFLEEDFSFMMDLIRMSGNLDESRGDRIRIQKKTFPKKKISSAGIVGDIDDIVDGDKSNIESVAATQKEKSDLSFVPFWIWIIMVVAVLTVLLAWLISKKTGSQTRNSSKLASRGVEKTNEEANDLRQNEEGHHNIQPNFFQEKEFEKLRNYLVNTIVGNPSSVSKLMGIWKAQSDQGTEKVAQVFNMVDRQLIKLFDNHMSSEDIQSVESRLHHLEDIGTDLRIELLQVFKKDFAALTGQASNDKHTDLFSFLDQLNNAQLKLMIQGEETGIQGLILAQLRTTQATKLLNDLNESRRSKVLVSMGQIQNMTVRTYRELAESLSSKALSLGDMKYVSSDGVETISSILVDMPINSQSRYLNQVAEQDLDLAHQIRRFFVPFDDLISLEERQRIQVLETVDRGKLAEALLNCEEDFIVGLLGGFPERQKQMIMSSLQEKTDITIDDVEKARKEIVQHVRKELIKQGGVRK
jgi:flagellar motor switch protein FliG